MEENPSVTPSPLAPHPHKHFFIIGSIFTVLMLLVATGYLYFENISVSQVREKQELNTQASEQNIDGAREVVSSVALTPGDSGWGSSIFLKPDENHAYIKIYESKSKIFLCFIRLYSESACDLYVADSASSTPTALGIRIDRRVPGDSFLPSANGKVIAIILEDEIVRLDPETAEKSVFLKAPANQMFGVYSDFPSFIPRALWIDMIYLQYSLYSEDAKYDSHKDENGKYVDGPSQPVETRIVELR